MHMNAACACLLRSMSAQPQQWNAATAAVDQAARLEVDALILADVGLMGYAARCLASRKKSPKVPRMGTCGSRHSALCAIRVLLSRYQSATAVR